MGFKKGQSGNPGGRPKELGDVREYARGFCREAIDGLVAIARSKKTSARVKVAAWVALLDRGIGRPAQAVHIDTAAHLPQPIVLVYGPPPEMPDGGPAPVLRPAPGYEPEDGKPIELPAHLLRPGDE